MRAGLSTAGLSAVVALWLYATRLESDLGPVLLVLVWGGLFLCLLPGVLWLTGQRRSVPIFEAICLSYGIQDVAPALVLPNEFKTVGAVGNFTEAELASALLIVVLGIAAMLLSYWWMRYGRLGGGLPHLDLPLDENRLAWYLPGAVVIGGLLSTASIQGNIPTGESGLATTMLVLINQLAIAVAILGYRLLDRVNPATRVRDALLLAIGVSWAVVVGLTTTMLESVLIVPVILATVGIQRGKRSVWVALAAGAVAYLLILQPVKYSVRSMPTDLTDASAVTARLDAWLTLASNQIDQVFSGGSIDDASGTGRESAQRLDFVHVLVHVRSHTPSVIPYLGGFSYSYLLTGWVPRLVWADKPTAQSDNIQLVLTYALTTPQVLEHTSMALGTIAEAYANFGDAGVVVFMLLQGLALGAACRMFSARGDVGGQAVLLSVLVFFLNGINTNTATLYGGLVQNLAANAFVLWLLAGTRPPRTVPRGQWLSARSAVSPTVPGIASEPRKGTPAAQAR